MGVPPALAEALGAAPGGATEAEKAEWVSVLTSCNLDSYFRTLAEQGIGSVGQLCAARAAGELHRALNRACVPSRVRDQLYALVQTSELESW
eukprot:COSAG04_NODE_7825_length_1061_cov_1.954262_2_plen_91_part_01